MHGNARQERDVTGPIVKDKEVVSALLGLAASASVATSQLHSPLRHFQIQIKSTCLTGLERDPQTITWLSSKQRY